MANIKELIRDAVFISEISTASLLLREALSSLFGYRNLLRSFYTKNIKNLNLN